MMISTKNPRLCYGLTMLEAAERYKDVVVLSADMMGSFQMAKFAETFPDRFFNVGVAEQNMAGIAAGMATCGKIPFVNTFSCFASMRALEMLRTDIAYPRPQRKGGLLQCRPCHRTGRDNAPCDGGYGDHPIHCQLCLIVPGDCQDDLSGYHGIYRV